MSFGGIERLVTRWGDVMVYQGKRYRQDPAGRDNPFPLGGWVELPTWVPPTLTDLHLTEAARWENYRRVALLELDQEFPG